ncbi:MAG: amine oxidase [Deltaproteobacteria bacterium RIFOXYB12_FULL_58_9]|nr:MAG: amine oxidase [Deltaproteobacteria bacterium RIFOXYB12_FULL_58_9]
MIDVLVVGGGISGLAFAWKAATAGRQVVLLESSPRVGGCIYSHSSKDGFWFEMGAHTVYNSYGGFLEMGNATGACETLVQRGPARSQFGLLRDGTITWLTPPKVLLHLDWLEAAARFPFNVFRCKEGQTVASHFSRLLGPKNFAQILSPFFAAVPSQSADLFPAAGPGSLFKKRPRRKEIPRSFGFHGGLQTVCTATSKVTHLSVHTDSAAMTVARNSDGWQVRTHDGRVYSAPLLAIATPASVTPALVDGALPGLANAIRKVETVAVESVGVVLPRDRCWMPECAFVVPTDDLFFSMVTRDPFPDPDRRAFTFHFRPGISREKKRKRIVEVLRLRHEDLPSTLENAVTLPSATVDHAHKVAEIEKHIPDSLALVGNYFEGLAIEDCVGRAFAEWNRVGSTVPLLED